MEQSQVRYSANVQMQKKTIRITMLTLSDRLTHITLVTLTITKLQLQPVLEDHDQPVERDLRHRRPQQGRRCQPLGAAGQKSWIVYSNLIFVQHLFLLSYCPFFSALVILLILVILIKNYHEQHFLVNH